ncbi:helix-turn-helix domain-containing protein [Phthorimaea operculella]|nr:helix-turn-helix domain-containing protein [Phthorimaea operculella]
MSRLTDYQKYKIIFLYEDNTPIKKIARELNIARNTVKLWIRRYGETGSVQRNRTGPKPIMFTDQSERHRAIVAQHQEHPFATTIHCNEKVFKSDKDGKQILWRKKGQRYEESCMLPCRTSGRISLGYWGWMSSMGPVVTSTWDFMRGRDHCWNMVNGMPGRLEQIVDKAEQRPIGTGILYIYLSQKRPVAGFNTVQGGGGGGLKYSPPGAQKKKSVGLFWTFETSLVSFSVLQLILLRNPKKLVWGMNRASSSYLKMTPNLSQSRLLYKVSFPTLPKKSKQGEENNVEQKQEKKVFEQSEQILLVLNYLK